MKISLRLFSLSSLCAAAQAVTSIVGTQSTPQQILVTVRTDGAARIRCVGTRGGQGRV